VSDPTALDGFELEGYDGVLAFGDEVRDVYCRRGWGRRAWTWHEAADVRVFRPLPEELEGHLVWIGNWGDEERSREIHQFLLEPIAALELRAAVHGVRYPPAALAAVEKAGADYRGWIANYRVPSTLARFLATVHVPRRPYLEELRGVPTIRPFEALACGVPLVCARWDDPAGLFRADEDFLVARDPAEMTRHLRALCEDSELRSSLAANGRQTILERHTCAHRVDELLEICGEIDDLDAVLGGEPAAPAAAETPGEA
jgi:spore maturation protein CgeB